MLRDEEDGPEPQNVLQDDDPELQQWLNQDLDEELSQHVLQDADGELQKLLTVESDKDRSCGFSVPFGLFILLSYVRLW